jgi:enoyl-CoA hydratase/carnithine racemase
MRICGESSRLGIPARNLGLVVGYSEMQALIAVVGYATALEILFEGRFFDAAEALRKGMVNRVVPDADVEKEAYATAQRIAAGAPLSNRWHKKFAKRLLDPRPLTAAEREEEFACFGSEDYNIGYRAFLEKKKPEFKGR